MSDRESYRQQLFAEALAPYGESSRGSHKKVSISLPAELLEVVRASARASGSTVSAMIAASLRRTLEEAEQASLDRALAAQAQENLDWAEAILPMTAKLWANLEW